MLNPKLTKMLNNKDSDWERSCVVLDRSDLTRLLFEEKDSLTEYQEAINIANRSLPFNHRSWPGYFWEFM